MRREGRCHVRRQDSSDTGTVTTPTTTDTNTNKINPSSATDLTSPGPVVGVRNDGQHLSGLPPHIAQIIAGHRDINVTLGYKAVYPDEAIQAHQAFLARRRALRPSEEYRVPTDDEWAEF